MRALEDLAVDEAFGAALFVAFDAESVRLRAAGSICMAGELVGARRGEAEGRLLRGATHS